MFARASTLQGFFLVRTRTESMKQIKNLVPIVFVAVIVSTLLSTGSRGGGSGAGGLREAVCSGWGLLCANGSHCLRS